MKIIDVNNIEHVLGEGDFLAEVDYDKSEFDAVLGITFQQIGLVICQGPNKVDILVEDTKRNQKLISAQIITQEVQIRSQTIRS